MLARRILTLGDQPRAAYDSVSAQAKTILCGQIKALLMRMRGLWHSVYLPIVVRLQLWVEA